LRVQPRANTSVFLFMQHVQQLVLDIGNSVAKVGIFNQQDLIQEQTFVHEGNLISFLHTISFSHAIYSTVRANNEAWIDALDGKGNVFQLTSSLPVPIQNKYATPHTLGMDRLAAVCGAKQMFPADACLVIDAGTCITYDYISSEGIYYGGGISPGLLMRLKAMHQFTAKLPVVEFNPAAELVGDSTITCMQSGVSNGTLAEIDGIIERYKEKFGEMKVILCGGDTQFFEKQLKGAIFAVQNMVLRGLNSILQHNVGQF
jgi:type III pantothenate kinase